MNRFYYRYKPTSALKPHYVLIHIQIQSGPEQKYKGVIDVLGQLYKEGGLKSIFRGSFATILRDGPGSAAYVHLEPALVSIAKTSTVTLQPTKL